MRGAIPRLAPYKLGARTVAALLPRVNMLWCLPCVDCGPVQGCGVYRVWTVGQCKAVVSTVCGLWASARLRQSQPSSKHTPNKWRTQEFFVGGVQQIQLRTEDREDGDLGAVAH